MEMLEVVARGDCAMQYPASEENNSKGLCRDHLMVDAFQDKQASNPR